MKLWLFPAVVLALASFIFAEPSSRAAWGPGGCYAAPVAVAANVPLDGWYESANYPGWWVRYASGRVAEWQEMPKAKPTKPHVETDAVLRMGNTEVHIDGKHQNTLDRVWAQAVGGPPPDDSHKWFVLVVGKQGCPASAKLKADWKANDYLRSFARPELDQQKESFMHFHWFDKDDESQKWRFNDALTGYPTVLLTPPRNGKLGTPGTVVFQQTYGMRTDPKRFTDDMRAAMRQYLAKLPPAIVREYLASVPADDEGLLPEAGTYAAPSPVKVKPKSDAAVDPNQLPPNPEEHAKVPPQKPSVVPGGDAVTAWLYANRWYLAGAAVLLLLVFKDKVKAFFGKSPVAPVSAATVAPVRPVAPPRMSNDEAFGMALQEWMAGRAADAEREKKEEAKKEADKKAKAEAADKLKTLLRSAAE